MNLFRIPGYLQRIARHRSGCTMPMHWDSILPDWRFQQSLGRLHSTSTPQVLKLCWTMRRHVKIVKTLEMCWYFHIFPQRPEELQGISGCKWPRQSCSLGSVRWFFLVGFWAQCGEALEVLYITFQHLRPLTSPWTSNGLKVCRLNKGSAQHGSTKVATCSKMFQIGSMFQSLAQRVDFSNRSIWRW